MTANEGGAVTRMLRAAEGGDALALDGLLSHLYEELRVVAGRALRREGDGHTLTPTALVHEAYLKLFPRGGPPARDRAHLMALASRAMRQVLVDHARARMAGKREGGWARVTLVEGGGGEGASWATPTPDPVELLALEEALASLGARERTVVECRVFGGMTDAEIALALGVTDRTVRRDWTRARAWLVDLLSGDAEAR
jgi:RNA polymerase sigma factor (TIGR02999 family)